MVTPAWATLTPSVCYYTLVKANIDEIPNLQLRLTLCDWEVNLPLITDVDGAPAPCSSLLGVALLGL
jgi:CCR4-NOT transcription complex subunit 7/8